MKTLKLEIVTPNGLIFDGDVQDVTFPGDEGEFTVLPLHAELLTLLKAGIIELTKESGDTESVVINSGHVKISENSAVALVEGAVAIRGTKESEIADALNDARQLLHDVSDSNVLFSALESRMDQAAKRLV
jgi:F-type H+-transporting ATPase subunit epsilon